MTLVERLGHAADARLVIINADELGLTRASNVGVYDALRHGAATSASLMVPAPWARDAAAGYRGEDVGVHLTFNAEWDTYRWGPISHSPSLPDLLERAGAVVIGYRDLRDLQRATSTR